MKHRDISIRTIHGKINISGHVAEAALRKHGRTHIDIHFIKDFFGLSHTGFINDTEKGFVKVSDGMHMCIFNPSKRFVKSFYPITEEWLRSNWDEAVDKRKVRRVKELF